jgi:outer membrane protein TolC
MFSQLIKLSLCLIIASCIAFLVGCQTSKKLSTTFAPDTSNPTFGPSYLQPSDPLSSPEDYQSPIDSISPEAMIDYQNIQYSPITLSDCITRALRDSEVFRDLGGTLLSQRTGIETVMDPAVVYTDPTFGEDAALSAFDANLASSLIYEKNDRPFNNLFSGDTDGILTQDLGDYVFEISKLSATGTQFTSRSTINYDHNNQAGNRYGHAWQAIIDSEFRHPLLQGSGSLFNRIAGPSQIPGSYNGVLIARTNTEISLADFQQSVREFVSNVENAYWDLYYGYRELNAQTDARDAAYMVFKDTEAEANTKRISGLERASAEEQYLRFESAVYESLEGRPVEGTQTNSGSTGGSFRRTAGVRVAERRLRYLIGMPITDGTLLKPSDRPDNAPMVFDWDQSITTALSARPETRRQRWLVKQRELELTAAKNFLLPRLDLVGNYRFRGLGKSLTGGSVSLRDDINAGTDNSAAFSDLASGDFQEVQIGAELRMPVGFRRANAAVRNAELLVQRARAILTEQERKILLDLSNAIAESRRSHGAMKLAEKRYKAAVDYRDQAAIRASTGRSQFDVLLEAQRRILESQLQFINAEVEYAIALKNVRYEQATFLQYHGIALSESESNPQAYVDYERRLAGRNKEMSYVVRDAVIGLSPVVDVSPGAGAILMNEDGVFESAGDVEIIEITPPLQSGTESGEGLQPVPVIEVGPDGKPVTGPPLGKADSNVDQQALANAIAQLTGENPEDVTQVEVKPETIASQPAPATAAATATVSDSPQPVQSGFQALPVLSSTPRNATVNSTNSLQLDRKPFSQARAGIPLETSRRSATMTPDSLPQLFDASSAQSDEFGKLSFATTVTADSIQISDLPATGASTRISDTSVNKRIAPLSLTDDQAIEGSTVSVLTAEEKKAPVSGPTDATKKADGGSATVRVSDASAASTYQGSSSRRVR